MLPSFAHQSASERHGSERKPAHILFAHLEPGCTDRAGYGQAEGFNPSNATTITGGATAPVIARCVKPFIVPNCDPQHGGGTDAEEPAATFFNTGNGRDHESGRGSGGHHWRNISICFRIAGRVRARASPGAPNAGPGFGGPTLYYYPAQMPPPQLALSRSCTGGTNFEQEHRVLQSDSNLVRYHRDLARG